MGVERRKLTHTTAATENMQQVNQALAEKCQRFVIGRDAALVHSLAGANGLPSKVWRPKNRRVANPSNAAIPVYPDWIDDLLSRHSDVDDCPTLRTRSVQQPRR